ncbi:hypothetical protein Tco_1003579 [Tanacetum coccineum]|uniref:Reverse transcriptase domain-containing protein n=1 Tax=Tanacetum coccineum TaxID=301880 RepID=A0ABQ5F9I4_9ASTR
MVQTSRQNLTPEQSPEPNPDIATIITHQLQNIIPQIVTQATANVNNANGGNGNGGNNGCSYKTFTACNPKEFDGNSGAVGLTHWIEKMESVFDNSGCTANQRVRFHELAKLVPHLVTPESSRIKRYINGLAPQIRGMLWATQPTTIQIAIFTAGILTDEAVRSQSCDSLRLSNVEPLYLLNLGYVIEIADGENIEVDRIIRDCKLELGNSLFILDLITVGVWEVFMDVLGERQALMNAKIDVPRISDILVMRDFTDVFSEDLLGLPPQRQVEFRIDLVPGATPVAKVPYRLGYRQKCSIVWEKLQELQDKGFLTT